MVDFSDTDRANYYQAALTLLRFAEHRAPTQRRFGAESDALWKQFRGDLTTSDRIQLMIADAHAQWPGSVGPSAVFGVLGVSEDDAFGPDWAPLPGMNAESLWRSLQAETPPSSPAAALKVVADMWGMVLSAGEVKPPALGPADKLVVAGPSAVVALIEVFVKNSELNWARQITVVATPPGHRQVAAAAGMLLNLTAPVKVLDKADSAQVGPIAGAKLVLSGDAAPDDASAAKDLVR